MLVPRITPSIVRVWAFVVCDGEIVSEVLPVDLTVELLPYDGENLRVFYNFASEFVLRQTVETNKSAHVAISAHEYGPIVYVFREATVMPASVGSTVTVHPMEGGFRGR